MFSRDQTWWNNNNVIFYIVCLYFCIVTILHAGMKPSFASLWEKNATLFLALMPFLYLHLPHVFLLIERC